MKLYKMTAAIFLLSVSLFASSIVVSSDVTTNTLWNTDTVLINKENLEVKEGTRLTINAGVHVIFVPQVAGLYVKGTISVLGAPDDSVYFYTKSLLRWQGIRILSRSTAGVDSSFFDFCNLVYSSPSLDENSQEYFGGVLYCGTGRYVSLKNSVVSDVYGAFSGAVYVDTGAFVQIKNCSFLRNESSATGGGAITTADSGSLKLEVENCEFKYNTGRNGGAILIGKGANVQINNSFFFRDTTTSINPETNDLKGGAIAIFGPSDVTIRNTLIIHCRAYSCGGGIYSEGSPVKLINCTISHNETIYGGGIYFANGGVPNSPILINTIVGGNGKLWGVSMPRDSAGCGIYLDSSVTPIFRHCQMYDTVYDHTINKYNGEFTNCKYTKTRFCYEWRQYSDTTIEGFRLYAEMPIENTAIDAGTPDTTGLGLPKFDLTGKNRINGTAIDIGALEDYDDISFVNRLPNKEKQKVTNFSDAKISIYSLNGKALEVLQSNTSSQAVYQIIKSKYPKGTYLVQIKEHGKLPDAKKIMVK